MPPDSHPELSLTQFPSAAATLRPLYRSSPLSPGSGIHDPLGTVGIDYSHFISDS